MLRALAPVIWAPKASSVMVGAGAAVTIAGIICLVRIMAPPDRFKVYWIGAVLASAAFSAAMLAR